ncbi:unnamed protein product [Notodromas monacha]|uniref:F-box domain-containing protein n=1 Tax=Notodromas monacha TaxID=399045 RepID=A0A7R9GC43_9CRUS|nr:unnamed protein product [Notodromas monacha]CAG0915607.1 unnamed protein product [Notodromas monacha]
MLSSNLPNFPDEVTVQICRHLHWGDALSLARLDNTISQTWKRVAQEPFMWPTDFHFDGNHLEEMHEILQLGGRHFQSLKFTTQRDVNTKRLLKTISKRACNAVSLFFEKWSCEGTVAEDWEQMISKLPRLTSLRFLKTVIDPHVVLRLTQANITGLQISFQREIWGPKEPLFFQELLSRSSASTLTYLDISGTKMDPSRYRNLLVNLGPQLKGINLLADEGIAEMVEQWQCENLRSFGIQFTVTVEVTRAPFLLASILRKMSVLKTLKLSGHLSCLALNCATRVWVQIKELLRKNLTDLRIVTSSFGREKTGSIPRDVIEAMDKLRVLCLQYPIDDYTLKAILQCARSSRTISIRTSQYSDGHYMDSSDERPSPFELFVKGERYPTEKQLAQLRDSDFTWVWETQNAAKQLVQFQNPSQHSRPDLCNRMRSLISDFPFENLDE